MTPHEGESEVQLSRGVSEQRLGGTQQVTQKKVEPIPSLGDSRADPVQGELGKKNVHERGERARRIGRKKGKGEGERGSPEKNLTNLSAVRPRKNKRKNIRDRKECRRDKVKGEAKR